jgi:hypothetical protein
MQQTFIAIDYFGFTMLLHVPADDTYAIYRITEKEAGVIAGVVTVLLSLEIFRTVYLFFWIL